MIGNWVAGGMSCSQTTGIGAGERERERERASESDEATESTPDTSSDSTTDSDEPTTDPPCTATEPGFSPEYEVRNLPVDDLHRAVLRDLMGDGRLDLLEVKDGDTWSFSRNNGQGFEPRVDWPVPVLITNGSDFWTNDQWAVLDMDGDGRDDLVWSAGPAMDPVYQTVFSNDQGVPHWRVYVNDESGFASNYTEWPLGLTSMPEANEFSMVRLVSIWSQSAMWDTVDLNGDRRPDLVITGECPYFMMPCQALSRGSTGAKWSVRWNTGDGFSSEAVDWSVPWSGKARDGLDFSSLSRGYFATMDLSGDGPPDFVWGLEMATWSELASTIDEGAVFGRNQGQPHWRVFLNTGNGFAADYLSWAVPMDDPALNDWMWKGFYAPDPDLLWADIPSSNHWTTRDFNGDGLPDLVWRLDSATLETSEAELDAPYWRVFRGRAGQSSP